MMVMMELLQDGCENGVSLHTIKTHQGKDRPFLYTYNNGDDDDGFAYL